MKHQKGFTLPEVLVALLLVTLLCAFAVPSLLQSWQQVTLDAAVQQLHRDLRWAQRLAWQEQKRVTVTFFQSRQPYYYVVRYAGNAQNLHHRVLPAKLKKIEAQTIIIQTDRTFQKNGHILLQKGEEKRYVYFYQTGRTRLAKKALS